MSADPKILLGLLDATMAFAEFAHAGQAGRVLLGVAVADKGGAT